MGFFSRPIERVAIIGSGAQGVAVANVFKKENAFKQVKVFEKRPAAGGLWHYYKESQDYELPSLDPSRPQEPLSLDDPSSAYDEITLASGNQGTDYFWTSASYDLLETNVPTHFMQYSEFPWKGDNLPLFPHRSEVLKYVQRFAENVADITEFGVNVYSVKKLADGQWELKSRAVNPITKGGVVPNAQFEKTELFDAVIVVAGPYDNPHVPEKKGLREWLKKYPGTVTHSKSFRRAEVFKDIGGELVIIGNGTSGIDISLQAAQVLDRKVIKSVRSESYLPVSDDNNIRVVDDVVEFDADNKSLKLADGTVLENVAHVIFATGYLRSFPFLSEYNKTLPQPLITDGQRVHGVYHHTLSTYSPGLAFVGLTRFILPNRTAEIQGLWLSRVFSNKVEIPSIEEQKEEEQYFEAQNGDGFKFHDLQFPEDLVFFELLRNEAYSQDKSVKYQLLAWDDYQLKLRAALREVRVAFIKHRQRTNTAATSIQQLIDEGDLEVAEVEQEIVDRIASSSTAFRLAV
ncbi:unnamed protein product [Kuraishia capsulata CBS 1993]|uniref:FAD/NAD(P)-binding domain-containing protein n=1 Tax=Kuraishia capsulata CBS 1993 TaxID=1382522 RepID=W6ML02_9ASCO|nr:uncharacterized protein KUCA_T00003083001 [Kuraishia capsulata CBS 1993]CDK27106.1 unnamed protein product [Kuraishia capsulata CBS 1993]